MLPFRVSCLGYTSPSVSATNQLFNIVAIPSGVHRYYREGRMVRPLTWAVVIETLPGVFIRALVRIDYLPSPNRFRLFAAIVLLYVGGRMLRDLLQRKRVGCKGASAEPHYQERVGLEINKGKRSKRAAAKPLPGIEGTRFDRKRIEYDFYGEHCQAPTMVVLGLSFLVGIVGGAYGIGGGAMLAPFFVSFFRLPVHTVAGATLMGTFVTSVAGVVCYWALAPFHPNLSVAPDWMLGLLFGVGGMGGIYLGARLKNLCRPKPSNGRWQASSCSQPCSIWKHCSGEKR